MSPGVIILILAGAGAGLGLALIVREFVPAAPALGPALQQLQAGSTASTAATPAPGLAGAFAARLRIPHQELNLIGQSAERHALNKAAVTLLGLAFPSLFSLLLAVAGIHLGFVIPAIAGVGLAMLFFFLADVAVRQRASEAREEFSRAVAVYLDLVALELAASHGPVEALERAAQVGGGWVSARIRQALETSRYRLEPPWEGLKQVAAEIGVPDLGDVGDIMQLVGDEGAQVYETMRSRAESLRTALLAKEEDRANTATTVLYIPTSLLVFVLFALAAYPFLARLVAS